MLSDALDEAEHQALDALEEAAGTAEADPELCARVGSAFERIAESEAHRALAAGRELGEFDERELGAIESALAADPRLALGLATTVEMIGLGLGLGRDKSPWSLLIARSEAAAERCPPVFAKVSLRLSQTLRDGLQAGLPTTRKRRIFRMAMLGGAGLSVRTRALCAETPDQFALARSIVSAHPEASAEELVDAFDRACASTVAGTPEPVPTRPKRRFTWLHALLAMVVLGLTLWHYLWR